VRPNDDVTHEEVGSTYRGNQRGDTTITTTQHVTGASKVLEEGNELTGHRVVAKGFSGVGGTAMSTPVKRREWEMPRQSRPNRAQERIARTVTTVGQDQRRTALFGQEHPRGVTVEDNRWHPYSLNAG